MPTWNLDKAKVSKSPDTIANIKKILDKYGVKEKDIKFEDIFSQTRLTVVYKATKESHELNFIVFGRERKGIKTYEFISPQAELYVGIADPETNDFNRNYAYLTSLRKGKYSGTFILELFERLAKVIGVKRIYLLDRARVICKKTGAPIILAFLKLMENGVSWYQKKGYVIDFELGRYRETGISKKKAVQEFKKCLESLRNVKVKDVYDDYAKITELAIKVIKNNEFNKVKSLDTMLVIENDFVQYWSPDYVNKMKKLVLLLVGLSTEVTKNLEWIFKEFPQTKKMKFKEFFPWLYKEDCGIYDAAFDALFNNTIFDFYSGMKSLGFSYQKERVSVSYLPLILCIRPYLFNTWLYKELKN